MNKGTEAEFKTLLTKEEYDKLMTMFDGNKFDFQTNHYFDTKRFSLKAVDASLRVKEREDALELTLKKKKGYAVHEFKEPLTTEEFDDLKETGIIINEKIKAETSSIIQDQKVQNYLSLSTKRMYLPYKNGILFIDESTYLGEIDYELEYQATSYHEGKKEFISLIAELAIQYKKAEKKIKRAMNAYKRLY
ncbi:MAG: CYTH domain-containing protein [Bacilli bacterium]|nr:CYTH domain-containing protein [Bacilli bacterium]